MRFNYAKILKTLISIHSKNIYDIYVSRSNAFLLSSDLRTLFSGRTYSFEVFPFSFKEYIEYYPNDNIFNAFTRYVLQGGFASAYQYQTTDVVYNYIRNDIFENVVYKYILEKYKIRNNIVFKNIVNFLIDNISNLTSLRRIENFLKSSGYSPSHNTIGTFINYLLNAFAFYEVKRYDIKGKKYLSTEQKYYLADHSIKYAILGTKKLDTGRVFENIVFMELKRRNYEVYVGVLPNKEVDFIAVKPNIKLYIQVAAFVDNLETLKRETAPFYEIKDNYPKIIIARTYQEEYSIDGIKIIDIANWLLS